jgi:hypothetical protein
MKPISWKQTKQLHVFCSVCWFDTNLLLEAKMAFYLKETLGSSSDLLARFTEALSKNLGKAKMGDLTQIKPARKEKLLTLILFGFS